MGGETFWGHGQRTWNYGLKLGTVKCTTEKNQQTDKVGSSQTVCLPFGPLNSVTK